MNLFHHPAFQSLVLPLLLALLGIAVLRAWPGVRWAALGAVLGLLGALALLPGFEWPAPSRAQKLPWIVLAGLALALLPMAHRAGRGPGGPWLGAVLCWAGASVWLMGVHGGLLPLAVAWPLGAAALALLAWGERSAPGGLHPTAVATGTATTAALTVAALGLAALAGSGGSLLLAQLAMMLATVAAVAGLWAWLRPASGLTVPPAVLMPLGLAGLSIALALPAQDRASAARLALLALAFAIAPLLSRTRWAARHPRWTPLATALLAAVPAALAVAWQLGAGTADMPGGAGGDDPYYTPRWK